MVTRIPQNFEDYLREQEKRLRRLERRPVPMSPEELLGPGIASQAVQIMDWDSEDATFNGFFYSQPGGINVPDDTLSWTGNVIAKDDGTGMQQVWNTDGPETLYWMRTYAPDSDSEGNVIFTEWKRFATASGFIGEEELDPDLVDQINNPPTPPLTDGLVPTVAPVVTPIGGIGSMFFRWTESPNADPVTYRLHVRAGAAPTTDGTYEVASGVGLTFGSVRKLKDGTAIVGDGSVIYHAIVTAEDDDNDVTHPPVASADATGTPAQVTGADIAVGAITTNLLTANDAVINALNGTTIVGVTMTSPVVQTDSNPARGIHLDSAGLRAYGPSGGTPFFQVLPAEGVVITTGKGTFDEVTVNKTMTLNGTVSVKAGTQVQLAAGTLAPGQPPTVSHGYDTTTFYDYNDWASAYGWTTDGTYWYRTIDNGDMALTQKMDPATGLWTAYFFQGSGIDRFDPRGCVYGGGFLWTLMYRRDQGTFRVYKIDPATMTGANTGTIADSANWNDYDGFGRNPALGWDSATNELLIAQSRSTNADKIRVKRYTMAGGTLTASATPAVDLTGAFPNDLISVLYGAFDFGGTNYYAIGWRSHSAQSDLKFFTTAGASVAANDFPLGLPSNLVGATYTGGVFKSMDNAGAMRTYTGLGKAVATGDASLTWWWVYTLFRTGGNYQTPASPVTKYVIPKRSKFMVTANTILPASPGSNDPDSVKFYAGSGTTEPARTAKYQQTPDPAVGVLAQNYSSLATSGNVSPDPASNPTAFPDSTAAKVVGTSLRADQTPKVSIPGNGAANIDGLLPPGVMLPYAGTGVLPPAGWKFCDGSALNTALYPDLFAAIGYTYHPTAPGTNTGTTFYLPNDADRAIIGASGSKVLGANGGASTKTIGSPNLPVHTHGAGTLGTNTTGSTHTHNLGPGLIATGTAAGTAPGRVARGNTTASADVPALLGDSGTTGSTHTHGVTGSTSDGGFANTPLDVQNPYLVARHIIKL